MSVKQGTNRFQPRPGGGGDLWTQYAVGVIGLTTITNAVVIGDTVMSGGGEKLRVLGGVLIDQTAPGAANAYLALSDGSAAGVSIAGGGRLRYNNVTSSFQVSISGGAWIDIATGAGAGPWDRTLTVIHPDIITDTVAIGSVTMFGTERLYVLGDARIGGKLTVTGLIDPTGVILTGGTDLYYESADGSTAAVAPLSRGRLRYLNGTGWQASSSTGAYVTIATGVSSPWQEAAGVVSLVTTTSVVRIGSTTLVGANGTPKLSVVGGGTSDALLHLQQPVGYLGGQAVVRLVDSTGTKWLEILGHAAADNYGGHAAFGGISADSNSAVAAQLIGSSSTHARAFDGTTLRSGALGADGFAYGQWLRARANGGSSSGTIAIGDGRPRIMFIGSVAEALQEGAGTHTGDMCGVLGFSGGDAAGALGAMNRVIGVAGAVGWTTDATGASAITTGAALIANSPQNTAATRTIGSAKGLLVENQGAVGVTNGYGIDIVAQSGAATANIGLRSQSAVVVGAVAPLGAELLHVTGNAYVNGKLTVTGLIDPTGVILTAPGGGTDLYYESANGVGAAVAPVGRARQRYNGISWQLSVSGGAWQDVATGTRVLTRADKGLSPLGTVGNGAPTGVAIGATPTADGYVGVSVNGVAATVGDGVLTKECYFSADLGVTAKPIADIVVGNALYWNGVVAGFNLAPADTIDLNYDV